MPEDTVVANPGPAQEPEQGQESCQTTGVHLAGGGTETIECLCVHRLGHAGMHVCRHAVPF